MPPHPGADRQLAQATLDALSAHICVLDQDGRILAVNRAWHDLAAHHGEDGAGIGVGANYLQECGRLLGGDQEQVEQFVGGLRDVADGTRATYVQEYACDSPATPCWLLVRASRSEVDGDVRLVVAHEDITERKQIQAQLHEKGALLRIAGGITRMGGWIYRIAERQLVWSDEVSEIHGVTAGHFPTRKGALELVAPEFRGRIAECFRNCIEQGIPFDEEIQVMSVPAQRIWVRVVGTAVGDGDGVIVRAQGAVQDISARKQQEERTARLAERLSTTLESITDAFFTLDRHWRFTYVNGEAERILRCRRDELIGRVLWGAFPEAVGTVFEQRYRGAVEQRRATEFEAFYPPLAVWVEVHVYPSDEGLAIYFRDIGTRKANELALRRSEESLRLAMVAGGLGTWDWDVASGRVEVSEQTRSMFGLPADTPLTLEGFAGMLHPQERERVRGLLQRAMDERTDFHAEFRIVRPDGVVRWLASSGRVHGDGDSQSMHMEGINLDITDRKHGERALIEVNEQLEQRVESRTRELAAATQQAESANAAKSAFLATMSHEIRTPMNGIVGMVEVLAHSALPDHQGDAVRTIRESAFALMHLIDDILDFSKIDAGKLELERVPVSIAEVTEGVCDTLGPLAASKNVELFLFVSPEGPAQVWADPVRLRQVFYNLVGNAIKFSGGRTDTRGRVELRLEVACASPLRIRIEVRDNGIGMSESTQRHIFQSFHQAEVSTTRRFGGTGLGLAICKRLVGLMGGEIAVSSVVGAGTTFIVELPLEAIEGSTAATLPDLHGLDFILVAGPSIDAADLGVYLRCAGARTHLAQDGRDALRLCTQVAAPVVLHGISDDRERDEWLAYFRHLPTVRHLLVSRGRRRSARLAGPNVVTIDGNAMRRRSLLHAAAIAAGRAVPETGHQPGLDQVEPAPAAPTVAEARAQGRLILVAEDDTTNQKVLLRQLELLGYAAEIASDGLEALRLWRIGSYGLLLTDLHMPGLDGYDLTSTIRFEEAGERRMPILALTANALRGEALKARQAGLDEYLTKPLQLVALRELLAKWLPHVAEASGHESAASTDAECGTCSVLDIRILQGIVGDDPATLREVLLDYEQSALRSVRELRTAHAADDLDAVGAIAHRLKSSSRTVGAMLLGDLCAELENACRIADATAAALAFAPLEPALRDLLGSLDSLKVQG